MRTALALLSLMAASTLVLADDQDPTQSLPSVKDLTPSNFDSFVNGKKLALVEFYAPWCGHCKRLVPEYKTLGEAVASDPRLKDRVVVAKVDADAHRELGERFGVRGFPTIKFFGRGKAVKAPEDYQGGRTAPEFLSFLADKVKSDAGFARVDELDGIAAKFENADDKAALLEQARAAAATVAEDAKENADLYVKFMAKALEKGEGYIAKELARLEKMLDKGSMSSSKVEEVSRKVSVLSSFVGDEEDEDEDEGEDWHPDAE